MSKRFIEWIKGCKGRKVDTPFPVWINPGEIDGILLAFKDAERFTQVAALLLGDELASLAIIDRVGNADPKTTDELRQLIDAHLGALAPADLSKAEMHALGEAQARLVPSQGNLPGTQFRVIRVSNYDDVMVSDEWVTSPTGFDGAKQECERLNKAAALNGPWYHRVVPETYKLYEFQP